MKKVSHARRRISRGAALLLALPALFSVNPKAHAATDTWTGSIGASDWNTAADWSGGVPANNSVLLFTGSNASMGTSLDDDVGGLTVNGITFATGALAYTLTDLTSQAFTLNGPIINNSISAQTINIPITLAGTETVDTAANGGNVTIGGIISGATDGLTVASLGAYGSGTVTLTAANTYASTSGATTISAGTLDLNFNAVGAPAANIVEPTSTLSMGGGTLLVNGNALNANTQTFAATALTSGQSNITAVNNGTAPSIALGALTVTQGAMVDFSTTGTITTTTAGTTGGVLGAANTAGAGLGFATYGASDWATTDTTAGVASGSPHPIIGLSSLTTGGYVTTFPGTGGGANTDLQANFTAGGNTGTGTVRFNTPTATNINVNTKWVIVSGVLVTPNMGANNTSVTNGNWFPYYTNGAVNDNLYVWQNDTSAFFMDQGGIVNDRGSATSVVNYVQGGPGTVSMIYAAAGNATVNGYTGGSYLNGGTTLINADSGFGAPATGAAVNLNGGTMMDSGAATLTLDNSGANARPVVLGANGGGIASAGGDTFTVDGVISGAAGTGALVIGIPASSANGGALGLLPGTGAGTANTTAVYAAGTVILKNTSNSYTGGTILDSGVLQLAASSIAPLGSGSINLNGGTFQWGAGINSDISGLGITVSAPSTLDTNGNAVTFANGIGNSGTGSLTIASTTAGGSLTLNGASSYTGATNVASGALILANGASLGNTVVTVSGGAALYGKGNSALGSAGASLTLSTNASLNMEDGNIGGVTVNAPAASASSVALTLNGDTSTNNGMFFDVGAGGTGNGADELIVNGGTILQSGIENIILSAIGGTAPTPSGGINLLYVPNGTLTLGDFSLVTSSLTFGTTSYVTSLVLVSGPLGTNDELQLDLTAQSLNYYWTGKNNASWATTANFATDPGGVTPQSSAPSALDNVILTANGASSANLTESLNQSFTINSLTFTSGTTTNPNNASISVGPGVSGTSTLTLAASNSFLDAGGTTHGPGLGLLVQAGAAADSISANVNLGSSQTWEIDNASSNPLVISGTIGDGGGGYSLTKTGAGSLVLNAANTYTGGTVVNNGTVTLGVTNALASTSALTVNGSGTLDLAGNSQTVASLSDGGSSTGTVTVSSGTSTLTVNNTAPNTFRGTITDNNAVNGATLAIVDGGSSTLTLSGSNSYNGLTSLNGGGILVVANNYALGNSASAGGGLVLNSGTVEFTSANPNVAGLNSNGATGAGTAIILGNATAGTATTLSVGAGGASIFDGLNMQYSGVISDLSSSSVNAIGSLTVTGGSFLELSGANTFTGTTSIVGATTELQIGNALALQDSAVNLSGGGLLSFGSLSAATVAGLNGTGNLALSNSSAGGVSLTIGASNLSSTFTGGLSGAGSVIKYGTGSLMFTDATYTGSTTIYSGTVIIGGSSSLTGAVVLNGANGANGLTVQDSATVNSPGELFLAGAGGASYPGASSLIVTGGSFTTAGLSIGDFTRVSAGQLVSVSGSGSIIDNGLFDLYASEGTTQGTATVNIGNGTPGSASLAVNYFQKSGGGGGNTTTINLNGGTLEALSSSATFLPALATNTVTVGAGGATINTNGFNDTIAAPLTHGGTGVDGGLTKIGAGSLTLSGANPYNGPTNVNAGTLIVTGSISATASASVAANATLEVDGLLNSTAAVAVSGNLTGTGSVNGASLTAGTLRPGFTIVNSATGEGTLASSANVSLDSASALSIRIGLVNGTASNPSSGLGGDADQLLMSGGTFALNDSLLQVIVGLNEASASLDALYVIVNGGAGATGSGTDVFSNAPASGDTFTSGGYEFAVFYATDAANDGAGGNDVDVELIAVPEPATWATLLGGLGVLAVWQRTCRNRRHKS